MTFLPGSLTCLWREGAEVALGRIPGIPGIPSRLRHSHVGGEVFVLLFWNVVELSASLFHSQKTTGTQG